MTETCTTCRYGFEAEGTTFCLFDPPEFIPPNSSALKPVRSEGWCGKWQSRPDTTKSVPAPGSDPESERSSNLSVLNKRKKGVAAIV